MRLTVPTFLISSLLSLIFLIIKQSILKCPISLHLQHLRFFLVHFSLAFFPFFVSLSFIFLFFFFTYRHLLSLVSLLVKSKAHYMIPLFFFASQFEGFKGKSHFLNWLWCWSFILQRPRWWTWSLIFTTNYPIHNWVTMIFMIFLKLWIMNLILFTNPHVCNSWSSSFSTNSTLFKFLCDSKGFLWKLNPWLKKYFIFFTPILFKKALVAFSFSSTN